MPIQGTTHEIKGTLHAHPGGFASFCEVQQYRHQLLNLVLVEFEGLRQLGHQRQELIILEVGNLLHRGGEVAHLTRSFSEGYLSQGHGLSLTQ